MKNFVQRALLGAAFAVAAGVAGAQGLGLTVNQVFQTTVSANTTNGFAYNATANEVLLGQAAAPNTILRYNGNTGAIAGTPALANGSVAVSGLGYFAIGTDATGGVVAFNNTAPVNLTFWTSVNDLNPTTASVATFTTPSIFARNMDVASVSTVSSGTEQLVAVSGGNSATDAISVLRRNGGVIDRVALVTASATTSGVKAGATISDDGQWILGSSGADTPLGVRIFRNGTGGPLSSYNWVYQRELFAAAISTAVPRSVDVAVDASSDVGFALQTFSSTPITARIATFRLSDGFVYSLTPLSNIPVGSAFDRGGIDVDRVQKRIYYFVRPDASSALIGRLDYNLQLTAANDWQMFE